MKVYQLLDDHEDSSVLQALSKKGEIILNSIETLENTLKWETPYLTFFLEKEHDDLITYFDCTLLFLSQNALQVLSPTLDNYLQLFPVKLYLEKEANYYAMKPSTILDCIDKEKSVLETDEEGNIYPEKITLKKSKLSNLPIFRPFVGTHNPILVSEEFKKKVVQNGLTGFHFLEVEVE